MTARNPTDPIRDEADPLAAGIELQRQGLDLLLAEMRALSALMPGARAPLPADAEIEASFDNMPV
ncbi:hypothetical protein [Tabrizicola sp.]|uniref:hypothetical protein n=1 Tax=Tabrizicola sp. TaxID=2005166 RepID=UPI0025EF8B9A|nr:hypothetical protein [Tabrizicola sp.]MBY0351108.1 hypothetical protein [Tabrizicola sp.]